MPLYRDLSKQELDRLLEGAQLARRLCGASGEPSAAQLQTLYDALLADAGRTDEAVQGLGFGFGGLLIRHDWLEWAMLEDAEFGDDFAVVVSGRELGCSPLTMMQYRLEDREPWNLADLAEETVSKLRQLGQQAASK